MKSARFSLRSGFTLVELMIVMLVIGILAAIALVGVGQAQKAARDSRRQQIVKGLQVALECYQAGFGSYPAAIGATAGTISWAALGDGTSAPSATTFGRCYPDAQITDPYNGGTAVPASGVVTTGISYAYSIASGVYTIVLDGETRSYTFVGPK